MKLVIRSLTPAWDAEYEVCANPDLRFQVRTSTQEKLRHIRILDTAGNEVGHVYQNGTGVTGECRGRELLRVERRMGLLHRMIPGIQSGHFRWCSLHRGDIRKRDYDFYANRCLVHVYSPTYGVVVEYTDHLAQPLEVLVLVLAIEAIGQYT